jgi:hypothetical protein
MAEEPAPALVAICPYRKSNPDILIMQTSEVRVGHDAANGLNSTRRGCILVQRQVRASVCSWRAIVTHKEGHC